MKNFAHQKTSVKGFVGVEWDGEMNHEINFNKISYSNPLIVVSDNNPCK